MREADIMFEVGDFWVGRRSEGYFIYEVKGSYSESITTYFPRSADGLSIAVAYCKHLADCKAKRAK